jgi:hypothetical protein
VHAPQGGIAALSASFSAGRLWPAVMRASVRAVHAHQVPPAMDVVLLRYNTLHLRVPMAGPAFNGRLPEVGDTVLLCYAEGWPDNVAVLAVLPRPDNAQPLPDPEAVRLLHPSGALRQVDPDGSMLDALPSAATWSAGGAALAEVAAQDVRISGLPATGTATITGTAGTQVPPGLPMTGGGYLWYTTAAAVIGSAGTASVPFACATGGPGPNGSGPSALAYPFTGITAVSGTASGGAPAAAVNVEGETIVLRNPSGASAAAVARVGDAVQVDVGGTMYNGTITGGSAVVSAG